MCELVPIISTLEISFGASNATQYVIVQLQGWLQTDRDS